MSLQIWLPLNGDLSNQGLIDFSPTINTTPTWTNNGKIGKAMMAGSITMPANITKQILNNQQFSFTCWIYVAATTGSTSDRAMLFGNDAMGANNNRKFSIFQYPTCNDLHLSWQNDAASATFTGGTWSGVFPSNRWTHLAITYNNPSGKIYINGIYYASFSGTSNSSSFEYNTMLFANCPNNGRYLNDYRIYNHCLSDKEVEEISKGLILHYKLDNNGLGNPNYLTNSSLKSKINNFPSVSSSYTQTFEKIDGYDCFHIHSDSFGISSSIGWSVHNIINAHPVGTKFTLSAWIKTDNIQKGTTNYFSQLYYGGSYNNNGTNTWIGEGSRIISNPSSNSAFDLSGKGWTYCYIVSTFTRNDYTGMGAYYYLRDFKGDIYLRDFKFEIGDQPTFWIPHESELLGNNNIIDSSGYENNGILTGSLTISNDTARYSSSSYFGAYQTPRVNTPSISLSSLTNCTISWWQKNNTTGNSLPFVGQSGSYYIGAGSTTTKLYHCNIGSVAKLYKDGVIESSQSYNSNNHALTSGSIVYTYNEWHYYCITGVDLSTWTTFNINNYSTGWPVNSWLSDVRIYATALTAAQIAELYHTSASIDNKGNIYTRELVEE